VQWITTSVMALFTTPILRHTDMVCRLLDATPAPRVLHAKTPHYTTHHAHLPGIVAAWFGQHTVRWHDGCGGITPAWRAPTPARATSGDLWRQHPHTRPPHPPPSCGWAWRASLPHGTWMAVAGRAGRLSRNLAFRLVISTLSFAGNNKGSLLNGSPYFLTVCTAYTAAPRSAWLSVNPTTRFVKHQHMDGLMVFA